jgi:hypothetical protein
MVSSQNLPVQQSQSNCMDRLRKQPTESAESEPSPRFFKAETVYLGAFFCPGQLMENR